MPTFALVVVLAASDPDPRTLPADASGQPDPYMARRAQFVHRHAAILTSIGATATLGGAVIFGVGLHRDNTGTEVGGASLLAFGISLVVLGVIAWLWPGPVPPGWHASF